jgi:CPA1 family monovalent cation:H+ antiporter
MLITALAIAPIANRLNIPYTIALVVGGLALPGFTFLTSFIRNRLASLRMSASSLFPPLLFEGSLTVQFRHLRENLVPILPVAKEGVLCAVCQNAAYRCGEGFY